MSRCDHDGDPIGSCGHRVPMGCDLCPLCGEVTYWCETCQGRYHLDDVRSVCPLRHCHGDACDECGAEAEWVSTWGTDRWTACEAHALASGDSHRWHPLHSQCGACGGRAAWVRWDVASRRLIASCASHRGVLA